MTLRYQPAIPTLLRFPNSRKDYLRFLLPDCSLRKCRWVRSEVIFSSRCAQIHVGIGKPLDVEVSIVELLAKEMLYGLVLLFVWHRCIDRSKHRGKQDLEAGSDDAIHNGTHNTHVLRLSKKRSSRSRVNDCFSRIINKSATFAEVALLLLFNIFCNIGRRWDSVCSFASPVAIWAFLGRQ